MIAALSASHLAALLLPPCLHRIYVAQDGDCAGIRAAATLTERAERARIEPIALGPCLEDFNDDLRQLGPKELTARVRVQLAPEDANLLLDIGSGRPRPKRSVRRNNKSSLPCRTQS
jgi:hypothetical protein